MPTLQGLKFINRERPRSHPTPEFGLDRFLSSWNGPQPKQRDLLPMLLNRGFEASSEQRTVDNRQWHDLNPLLQRAESRPRTTEPPTAAYRRSLSAAGALERAGSKKLGSRQSTAQLYGEEEANSVPGAAKVEERLRQKLGQRAKETQRRAQAMRRRADAHGIFGPAVNEMRASSTCLCELRRSASVEEMRSEARHELIRGLPFEDEAAAGRHSAARGTPAAALQRKLEQLDTSLEAALAERRRRVARGAAWCTARRMAWCMASHSTQCITQCEAKLRVSTKGATSLYSQCV